MNYYFQLQYRIINRKLRDFGLLPLAGYLLGVAAFLFVSAYLFYKTSYAAYLYAALALGMISQLSERGRNDFLKTIFGSPAYNRIRLLENGFLSLPFAAFLLFKGAWMIAAGLLLTSALMSLLHLEDRLSFTLPTPFARYPFEFPAGFRKSFLMYGLSCFLVFKAVEVHNVYLGVFAVGLTFLTALTYYYNPENEYFVWVYNTSPAVFLRKKFFTACLYSNVAALPLSIAAGIFFPEIWPVLAGVHVLGCLFLALTILAKYAFYPAEMNVPQAFTFALCLWFPPMLLIILPLYYKKAVQQLNTILI